MGASYPKQRNFLFLQGIASRFFSRLGSALRERGHGVHRINFNGGDRVFWLSRGATDYRGDLKGWPLFLEGVLRERRITDIVLFGDCRPLHRAAMAIAQSGGILVHVVEEGYLRPNWITLEQGGVNHNSSLPRNSDSFRQAVSGVAPWDGGQPVNNSFFRRASEDVLYNLATVVLSLWYSGYNTHRPWHPFIEYGGWIRKFARRSAAKRRAAESLGRIASSGRPYFLFPLQLDCDSQIRHNSSFGRLEPAIEHVVASFASAAPSESALIISEHPLDNGLTDWGRLVRRIAAKAGVGARVIYLEGGTPEELIKSSRGLITVNSTIGFLALHFGRPVIALGRAIYDMADLTFSGSLDEFWTKAIPPDPVTFDAFRRVVAARTQINGSFFSETGLALAVQGAVRRMEEAGPSRALRPKETDDPEISVDADDEWASSGVRY